jgi:hypothetical protein
MSTTFVIVDKNNTLSEVTVKNMTADDLYKKCGFRKPDGFECRTTWENVKVKHHTYTVQLWARDSGKAGTENKYEFPPPVDTQLYFGKCALIQVSREGGENEEPKFMSLTKDVWLKIYETLFGGFEDINNVDEDDNEPDELKTIKKDMKTKAGGYLKDGFVVDSDEDDMIGSEEDDSVDDDDDDDASNSEDIEVTDDDDITKPDMKLTMDDMESDEISAGSELEEEDYDYSDD